MVAEPSRKSSREPVNNCIQYLNADNNFVLLEWLKPIQKAFTLEADTGFSNLHGRKQRFNSFIVSAISSSPQALLNTKYAIDIKSLEKSFEAYPNLDADSRRRLVVASRKLFHNLSKSLADDAISKPPHLKVHQSNNHNSNPLDISNHKLNLNSSIISIKGIGPKLSDKLSNLGIFLIKDILYYYPRDYLDYSKLSRISSLVGGELATIVATVRRCNGFVSPKNSKLSILELHLQDKTGRIKATRFLTGNRFSNPSYLNSQLALYPKGCTVAISGLVKDGSYGKSFHDPLIEVMESQYSELKSKSIGRLVPVYSLTEGLNADRFRDIIEIILPLTKCLPDPLSEQRSKHLSLLSKSDAISIIHRPSNQSMLKMAKRKIVFDEFYMLQLGLLRRRSKSRELEAKPLLKPLNRNSLVEEFFQLLPFSLTQSQKRVINQLESDLALPNPMARLLQGDVGSGKTVVAIAALLNAVQAGCQAALMAPTEVLAAQHYRTICDYLPHLNVNAELLTGSTPRTLRSRILKDLANGSLNVLIGTHALIEDPVSFFRLGLVVVDEQHRFGVLQRNRLLGKGIQPHLLTMTATPIPRTLALSLYGDLDISLLDELPPGRIPVQTSIISNSYRNKVYETIKEEVSRGQSVYIVLPLVDESEKLDLNSAITVHEELSTVIFPEFNIGLLHGKMSGNEKQSVINDFKDGKFQILVSTTVVEVGVDVPQATLMVIDHAERFGLSQLHQLRGRVGRGSNSSRCLLINHSKNSPAKQRLEVLVKSNDGFEISEIDLRLRGPGQILGTRQSGLPDFALASLTDDADVLDEARAEAAYTLENDPGLVENNPLRELLDAESQRYSDNAHFN